MPIARKRKREDKSDSDDDGNLGTLYCICKTHSGPLMPAASQSGKSCEN